jgi:ACR3 family arsenite efflux pump ArsB
MARQHSRTARLVLVVVGGAFGLGIAIAAQHFGGPGLVAIIGVVCSIITWVRYGSRM